TGGSVCESAHRIRGGRSGGLRLGRMDRRAAVQVDAGRAGARSPRQSERSGPWQHSEIFATTITVIVAAVQAATPEVRRLHTTSVFGFSFFSFCSCFVAFGVAFQHTSDDQLDAFVPRTRLFRGFDEPDNVAA